MAVKKGGVLRFVHADHLGSTSVETDIAGNGIPGSWLKYYAYGSVRQGNPAVVPTDRTYTGQKSDGTGLLYYNARYYDPQLGTFLSPDTVVPDAGAVVDYNRFLYVRGNPLKYSDPSGHCGIRAVGGPVLSLCSGGGGGMGVGAGQLAADAVAIAVAGAAVASGPPPTVGTVPPPPLEGFSLGQPQRPVIADLPLEGPAQEPMVTTPAESWSGAFIDVWPPAVQSPQELMVTASALDPYSVRFSQSSISYRFRDGSTIDDLAQSLLRSEFSKRVEMYSHLITVVWRLSAALVSIFHFDGQLLTKWNQNHGSSPQGIRGNQYVFEESHSEAESICPEY